jgi:hypothetical protein
MGKIESLIYISHFTEQLKSVFSFNILLHYYYKTVVVKFYFKDWKLKIKLQNCLLIFIYLNKIYKVIN